MHLRNIILGIVALGTLTTAVQAAPMRKKFIAHGWDTLWGQPVDMAKCVDQFVKANLDGISMSLQFWEPGKPPYGGSMFCNDKPYQRQYLMKTIENGRKISAKLKHNFVIAQMAPEKHIRWDDDKTWERICHNFGVMAWAAKQANFKGILLDPEDYGGSHQFNTESDEDYDVVSKLARKRGAQLMASAQKEFPDIVIFGLYLLSHDPELWNSQPDAFMHARNIGNLRGHFINGMMDVLNPQAKLVDGCEFGYVLEFDVNEYYQMGYNLRKRMAELVAPENRDKFYRQYQIGFGIYMDPYVKTKYPCKEPFNGSVYKRLVGNLQQSLEVADEYCWLYGERQHWFHTTEQGKANTWQVWIKDVDKVIDFAKNPYAYTLNWLDHAKRTGTLPQNLANNPQCRPDVKQESDRANDWKAEGLPSGWSFWQSKDKVGAYGLDQTVGHGDKTSLKMVGVGKGVFINSVSVEPGEWYVVEAYCKGGGYPILSMRWQSKGGWLTTNKDVIASFNLGQPDKDGWRRAVALARVPLEAARLVILVGDCIKDNSQETVWFDSLGVYKHSINEPKPIKTRK